MVVKTLQIDGGIRLMVDMGRFQVVSKLHTSVHNPLGYSVQSFAFVVTIF